MNDTPFDPYTTIVVPCESEPEAFDPYATIVEARLAPVFSEDEIKNHADDRQKQDQQYPQQFVSDRPAAHDHARDGYDIEYEDQNS